MAYSTYPTIKHETEAVRRALHGEPAPALTFDAFRAANVARCLKWHPRGIESWSPSDWLTAVTGELGELASLLKMRNRERDGLPGNKFSPTQKQIADELADVATYLDLLAEVLGVDLGRAVAEKFNEVSERVGFPDRIPVPSGVPASTDARLSAAIASMESALELFNLTPVQRGLWREFLHRIGSPGVKVPDAPLPYQRAVLDALDSPEPVSVRIAGVSASDGESFAGQAPTAPHNA
jgi:NTP pyrophosphatase (non-canonical NTP hydrolase)